MPSLGSKNQKFHPITNLEIRKNPGKTKNPAQRTTMWNNRRKSAVNMEGWSRMVVECATPETAQS